jgi:hypothetical protein
MRNMQKTITLDGNNFADFDGFVREFNMRVFGDDKTWHGGFGQLNDLLRGGYGSPEGSFTIEWLNAHKSREDLGKDAAMKWLLLRKDKVHPANQESWEKRIELMHNNLGDTIFQIIVDIIVRNTNITLILA